MKRRFKPEPPTEPLFDEGFPFVLPDEDTKAAIQRRQELLKQFKPVQDDIAKTD